MRWETEWSFNGKLCPEYSCQKLSKYDNWFLKLESKMLRIFLGTQCRLHSSKY